MRTLLLAFLLTATLPTQATAAPLGDPVTTVASPTSDPDVLIGTYRTDEATLYIARSGPRLVLTLAGQEAFDAFATMPANTRFNARAEALLRDAFAGDTDRLNKALPASFRTHGAHDFARLLGAFTDRLGDAASVHALGTTVTADDGTVTYVRVRFADSEEVLKLSWRGGHLIRITRSALPRVTAYPVRGADHRFAVLNEAGEPSTFLVFHNEQVTARNADHTLVAARSF